MMKTLREFGPVGYTLAMDFPPLHRAKLIKRYKRFLADVELETGEYVTATCPNTGTMMGLTTPGMTIFLSHSSSPTRKYAYTWEITERPDIGLIGINTARPNGIVGAAVEARRIPALFGYSSFRREVKYGVNSRIDLLAEGEGLPACYVEVKNVTLYRQPGHAEFPDCKTDRGAKHLHEMAEMVKQGHRALMVYCIQGGDARRFGLTADLDPTYVKAYGVAKAQGVEAIALTCHVSLNSIQVTGTLPVEDP
jgi:sugar fermentation stimulation protein A